MPPTCAQAALPHSRMVPPVIACALLLLVPAIALAQTPAARPAAKKTQLAKATRHSPSNHVPANSAARPGVAEVVLSAAELAIAESVYVGRMSCELGAFVTVMADPARPGYFHVTGNGFKYHMLPVVTSTGAARLEDPKGGAVWLQIANKSMLMSQRLGRRLADECMSPAQMRVAEFLRSNPPPSLLEPLPQDK